MRATAPPGPAWLFCPGDRPDRFAKAADAADAVVLDLEDAVAPDRKDAARDAVVQASRSLDPRRTIVRVNPPGGPWGDRDLAAIRTTRLRTVMLPKAESTAAFTAAADLAVIALCETAAGVLAAASLAADPRCVAVAWGGQDLAHDLASEPLGPDGRLHPTGRFAREQVRFAAAAAGRAAIDTVRVDLDDEEGLAREATAAASAGFHAKLVIHPRQVSPVRVAFRPTDQEITEARRIVDAAHAAAAEGRGVVLLDGRMVDRPVVARAERVLELAGAPPGA